MSNPTKSTATVLLAAGIFVGALLWWNSSRPTKSATDVAARSSTPALPEAKQSASAPLQKQTAEVPPEAATENKPEQILPGPVTPVPKPVSLAARETSPAGPETGPGLPPSTVLQNMRSVFRQYCARLGGNPVGNNAEITAALNGGNPRQVVFINPEDGLRINHRGELVDNWGTPFFFHQLSRTEMEIRSAGPDRKMWTADDLAIK
jgi:hypothetical protein